MFMMVTMKYVNKCARLCVISFLSNSCMFYKTTGLYSYINTILFEQVAVHSLKL